MLQVLIAVWLLMSVIQCHWPVCLQASWIATVLPQHRHICTCSFWCRLFWTTELVLLSCKHFHILSSWLKTQIYKELWRSESWTSQIYTIFYKLRASAASSDFLRHQNFVTCCFLQHCLTIGAFVPIGRISIIAIVLQASPQSDLQRALKKRISWPSPICKITYRLRASVRDLLIFFDG